MVVVELAAARPSLAASDRIRKYISCALQGDLRSAPSLFQPTPEAPFSSAESTLARQFRRRFVDRNEVFPDSAASPAAREVMTIYRRYWTRSLMGELEGQAGEAYLTAELRSFVGPASGPGGVPDSAVLERTIEKLEAGGIHVLDGMTRPYYDLMLWTRNDTTRYKVELTDTTQPVTVIFIGDFLIKGWSHFATLGHASTGGWATKEGLYCLDNEYDRKSETFTISYLKHEGRHFADYARFPALEQADLEYRGKLTELAFAKQSTYGLLDAFAANSAPNPNSPHAYANYAVLRDLSGAILGEATTDSGHLHRMPIDKIQRTARDLLAENTRKLAAAGAATTRGIIVTP